MNVIYLDGRPTLDTPIPDVWVEKRRGFWARFSQLPYDVKVKANGKTWTLCRCPIRASAEMIALSVNEWRRLQKVMNG